MKPSSKDVCAGGLYNNILRHRRNLTSVSNVCEAAPISLFWAPNGLNELPEFPFNLIGKSTMAFLTGQSWRVLKSWYTCGGLEQGFRCCFADGLKQSLTLSVVQASIRTDFKVRTKESMVIVTNVKVNSFYIGHYRDLELASSLARVRNSESSFQSNVRNLFLPGFLATVRFIGVSVTLSGVSVRRELTISTQRTPYQLWAPLLNQ